MIKKILTMLLLLAMVITLLPMPETKAVAAAQDTANSDVRIMSANVLAEFASWSGGTAPEATSTRVVKLEKMLNENNPMVVGTQEMSPTWYTAFKKLDSTKWGWLEESDVAGYSYYNYVPNKGLALNSVLYRKDLLTLNAHGVEAYTSRSNGQCIVWAVFTIQSTGKQFCFISTHWTPGSDKANERLAQAEQLATKVNSLRNTYGNTVICTGDFNCNDQSQEFRKFLVCSGSLDSRGAATTRGDHLNKIDHITATMDASFSYHTICYEANNAYAISDHPFVVADVKLSSALFFDFTDNTDSRAHYKQQNYRYNAYDYHEKYWVYDTHLVSARTIDKTSGALTLTATSKGNPYVVASTENTTDPTKTYGLSFNPKGSDIARVRFKLSGSSLMDSSVSPSVTVGVTNRSTGKWVTNKKTYTFDKATSGYVNVDISLTDSGIRSLSQVDSLRVTFDNIQNGTVTIDYIYIGKTKTTAISQSLFFDYSNTSADQTRYGGVAYGKYQFDKASNGYWATMETSTTSNTVYSDYTINNTAGTLSVKVAQGVAYNSGNGKYGPWLTTTKTYGTYPGRTASAQHPLAYSPKKAKFVQVAFKTQDCVLAEGNNPQIVVVYDYDTGDGTTARGDYTMIGDYTLSNGTYTIVTIPVSDQFKSASKITTFGLRFWNIKGTTSSAKVEIDYIFVGMEEALPTKHVYDHKTTAATCTAQGYTTHTCRTCKYSYKDTYVSAKGHDYKYEITKIPSIVVSGELTGTCRNCSGKVTVEMPMLNTTDYTKTVVTAATCTANGTDKYTWNVTEYGTFAINTNSPALGHYYVGVYTDPTCTTQGYITYTCSHCKDSYTGVYTDPTDHSYDEGLITTQPTCTEPGVKTYTCTGCGTTKTETVPATGHVELELAGSAPTCTTAGKTAGSYCFDCGEILVAQEVIPAAGHAYVYSAKNSESHIVNCKNCTWKEEIAHSFEDGLCICGERESKEPVLQASWKMGHTLNLASDISVNFAVSKTLLTGFDMDTVYILSEVDIYEGNSKTGTKVVKILPVEQGNYYYFTLTGLTAIHMNDSARSVLYGTKEGQVYYSAVDEYSIATYAYSQMNKASVPESLKILCADLLRYGSAAQAYKGYRTDSLADSAMTDGQKAYLSDIDAVTFGNTNRVLNDLENATITWAGKALNLESKVEMKFVFDPKNYDGDLSDLTLKVSYSDVNGETKTLVLRNAELYNTTRNLYAFTLDALLAAELRAVVSAQVYEGNTPVSCTLEYSPDTYGNNKTGNLGQLCKALFAYSDSAKAYFVGK